MAEETALVPAPAATPARREYRVVESHNPVMSTAGFEHAMRVAVVLADSGMMHKTLTHAKKGENEVELPYKTQCARAFMIVELADRLGESPMSVMQCASFVHGKLMLEGKFVDAVLTTKFGVKTQKDFGTWDPRSEKTILGEEGQGDALGIIVSGTVNGRREEVHGYVGGWKTTGNNSPWKPGAMRKMLGNRGVREFARIHEAGAITGIIGIIGDDEVDDLPTWEPGLADSPSARPRRQKANLAERLAGPKDSEGREGFDGDTIAGQLAGAAGAKTDTVETGGRPTSTAADTKTADAPSATRQPDTSGSAAGASTASQAETSGPSETQPGAGSKAADMTEEQKAAKVEELQQTKSGGTAAADDSFPGDKQPSDQAKDVAVMGQGPLSAFWVDVKEDAPWSGDGGVKKALAALYQTAEWKALSMEDQAAYRADVWVTRGNGKVQPAADPTAFLCWIDAQDGAEGGDAIDGTLVVLEKEPIFVRMPDPTKETVRNRAKAAAARCRA